MGWGPRRRRVARLVTCLVAGAVAAAVVPAVAAPIDPAEVPPGAWTMTATDVGGAYAPTFVGNGYLGERIPAAGMGYSASPILTDSQLAGFYAQDPAFVQQRADIPMWSTLAFSDGSGTYGSVPPGTPSCGLAELCPPTTTNSGPQQWQGSVSAYRQTLDLYHGVVTTDARWDSPSGRITDLSYSVIADRALPHVGVVRLVFTPHWSGSAVVTDLIDGTDTNVVSGDNVSATVADATAGAINGTDEQLTVGDATSYDLAARQISENVTALGTGLVAGVASTLAAPPGTAVLPTVVPMAESVGQQATIPVVANSTYTITKYVAIDSSNDVSDPVAAAQSEAASAGRAGWSSLLTAHQHAWASLWRTDIQVGDPTLQMEVRASLFYLLESARAGSQWSVSPGGLSSPGYNGHVFWDAETWMYPALLATHPDIAASVNAYRYDRLGEARQFAALTGFAGARFPWESALTGNDQSASGFPLDGDGTDPLSYVPRQIQSGDSVDTGEYEQHVTADIALAQWQYYLATGDKRWLATYGWPVLEGAAEFWASHATPDPAGGYDIDHVMGPDEYHGDVDNSAYINVAAATTLRNATTAAGLIGATADPQWKLIADGLIRTVPYDPKLGIHLEYDGYDEGVIVKQADTVMLQYPWQDAMPAGVAQNDLDYYQAHTDPDGPSMTDAIHAIDEAALGTPGCADDYFLRRSVDPFVQPPFAQFAETRIGGPFDFVTAVGGFLQEFLYGFSGLRWAADSVVLAPTLPPQIPSVTLDNLSWQGRQFTVAIGPRTTTVSLTSGRALPVRTPDGMFVVTSSTPLTMATRRPDLTPTADLARCTTVTASSADPSFPVLGAVDGDAATAWDALARQAWLETDLGSLHTIDRVTVAWGASRATAYTISVSADGRVWRRVAGLADPGATSPTDSATFPALTARYVRVDITSTNGGHGAQVDELGVYG